MSFPKVFRRHWEEYCLSLSNGSDYIRKALCEGQIPTTNLSNRAPIPLKPLEMEEVDNPHSLLAFSLAPAFLPFSLMLVGFKCTQSVLNT